MVTVYSLPNCVQCNATMRTMDKLGIEYRIESASDHAESLKKRGYRSAPIVRVETDSYEDWWSGFKPEKIKDLTKILT